MTIQGLLVDPALLTSPKDLSDAASPLWLQALETWLRELEVGDLFWWHLVDCTEILSGARMLADTRTLKAVAEHHKLDVNVGNIARRLNAFVRDRAHDAMLRTMTQELLLSDPPQVQPQAFMDRNAIVAQPLAVSLARLACDQAAGFELSKVGVVSQALSPGSVGLRIQCQVQLAVPDEVIDKLSARPVDEDALQGGDGADCKDTQAVDEVFALVTCPGELLPLSRLRAQLRTDPHMFAATIRRIAHKDCGRCASFGLGPNFWETVRGSAIDEDQAAFDKLLRVCARVAAGDSLTMNIDLRPIRQGAAADKPQVRRARDGASAWRATIADKGVGWRLHFWNLGSGGVEFEAVRKKSDPVVIRE